MFCDGRCRKRNSRLYLPLIVLELLDFQRFGLLCLMGMIFAAEYMQLLIHATAQRTFRQHTFYGEFNRSLRVLFQQFAQRDALEIADVASVLVIELIREL